MRTALSLAAFLISACLVTAVPAYAAGGIMEYSYRADKMPLHEEPGPVPGNSGLMYGGGLSAGYLDENGMSRDSSLVNSSASVWFKLFLWNSGSFSAGIRNTFDYISLGNSGEDKIPEDDRENVFDIEVLCLTVISQNRGIEFSAGRKFHTLGSGLLFDGRGDGAQLILRPAFAEFRFFGLYTGLVSENYNPFRLSIREFSRGERRYFFGGSASRDFSGQTVYLLGMGQIDAGDESGAFKKKYDSGYAGAGVKGLVPVLKGNIDYSAELVYEFGRSYTSPEEGGNTPESIHAFASVLSFRYLLKLILSPEIIVRYSYGSGDNDKTDYESPYGNVENDDTGFRYFGTFTAGYGLRPYLANIHLMSGGFAFYPLSFSGYRILSGFMLGGKYTYYMKDKIATPVNSGIGTRENRFIGQGLDLSLDWALFGDLELFGIYGAFFPGGAFEDRDSLHFSAFGARIIF